MKEKTALTVNTQIEANIEKVWQLWTEPEHIVHWNTASNDWHTTKAENDLCIAGEFDYRMEAKDGSFGFNFGGVYIDVIEHKLIKYLLMDSRKVSVSFDYSDGVTYITETFEAEDENPLDMQQAGWQAILDNFSKYVMDKA